MPDTVDPLPDDPSILKEMIVSLASELSERDAELKFRDLLIEKPKHQLADCAATASVRVLKVSISSN